MFSSCFGRRDRRYDDHEPLLPQYDDETARQRQLHEKLHTYQMYRALGQGYLPSNEQLVVQLRTLLAADVLNPEDPDLSDAGRRLVKFTKQFMHDFIELLLHKNSEDQIQDFLYFLSQARVSVDTEDIVRRAKKTTVRGDVANAYASLQTVGSLLLTNSDFRLFLSDLETIGRQVFADSAFSLSNTAQQVGEAVEPSAADAKTLTGPGADDGSAPTTKDLAQEAQSVGDAVTDGLAQTGQDAVASAKEHLSGDEKATIIHRLKQAVLKLRQRPDYTDSVATITKLLERYVQAYSQVANRTVEVAQEDVSRNAELDRAAHNFWSLLTSFGNAHEWKRLEEHVQKVQGHADRDIDFEQLMAHVGSAVQRMLTDPSFFDDAEETVEKLQEESHNIGIEGSMRRDVDDLLAQLRRTLRSVVRDEDVARLLSTGWKVLEILFPSSSNTSPNQDLLQDLIQVILPRLIAAIHFVPIPRTEVSTPDIDLLIENLILEPGQTVAASSFLPFRLGLRTVTEANVRKARFGTATAGSHLTTIRLDGFSIRASELGYWLRVKSGFFRFTDWGIASFALDKRGIDIAVDVSAHSQSADTILKLEDVRVTIHHLNYILRHRKPGGFGIGGWVAWLMKPVIRPLLRRTLEKQAAEGIKEGLHFLNRELVFARERLRATRVASPESMVRFVKAVAARWTPAEDPDVVTAVGVRPQTAPFKGVYAPGSLVKVWEEEGRRAGERVEDEEREGERRADGTQAGWRNGVFDVKVSPER